MPFHTRRIRKKPPLKPIRKIKGVLEGGMRYYREGDVKRKNRILAIFMAILGIFIVWKVMFAAYDFVADFDVKKLVFSMGSELKKDANGYVNIVLLGDGGYERDGADLVDTIMVASVDLKQNAVSLFSIPRDYYVPTVQFPGKINELYRNHKRVLTKEEAYDLFPKACGEITGLEIPYYIRVNFNAFVEVVDSLGGITVDVKEDLIDPYYPNETDNGYTLFEVHKGVQEMDGETALKFVRSRKTTSDFDRAKRQQLVIEAIREKAISKKMLTNPKALKNLYYAVIDNIDTNLTMREMISLAAIGEHMDRAKTVSKVINDDPGVEGGFLYTPERELYDGLFVLVPFGDNLNLIHRYADLIFHKRALYWDNPGIEVLSALHTEGVARNTGYQLNRYGFNIQKIDNWQGSADGEKKYADKTVIYYYNWKAGECDARFPCGARGASVLRHRHGHARRPADGGKRHQFLRRHWRRLHGAQCELAC